MRQSHVFREKAGKELTNDQLKALLTEGRTGIIKGFKSKQGNSFDAVVTLNRETFQTEFSFPERKFLKWIQWLHLGRDTRGALLVR